MWKGGEGERERFEGAAAFVSPHFFFFVLYCFFADDEGDRMGVGGGGGYEVGGERVTRKGRMQIIGLFERVISLW